MGTVQQFLASQQKPKISRDSRHIRWNAHRSPDDELLMRYHFVVVDDKHRREIMDALLKQISDVGSIVPVRQNITGAVKDSKLQYLFESFDSRANSNSINPSRIGKPVVRDPELYERRGTNGIEIYVARLFGE